MPEKARNANYLSSVQVLVTCGSLASQLERIHNSDAIGEQMTYLHQAQRMPATTIMPRISFRIKSASPTLAKRRQCHFRGSSLIGECHDVGRPIDDGAHEGGRKDRQDDAPAQQGKSHSFSHVRMLIPGESGV